MEMIHKTPEELDRMTLSEIAVAALDPQGEVTGETMDMAEVPAYLAWWNSLTDDEKLLHGQ